MKNRALYRTMMMTAGILAALVIVLSQTLPQAQAKVKKVQTEQKADTDQAQTFVSAPSDVVPSGSAVEINGQSGTLIQTFASAEKPKEVNRVFSKIIVGFFKTLFRVTIAPNAP